jgi:hypothetical protein
MPMSESTSHLRPDGTVFPPVTPDPPSPPGYVNPLSEGDRDPLADDVNPRPAPGPAGDQEPLT